MRVYKCYIIMGLMCLKGMMLIKSMNHETYYFFLKVNFRLQQRLSDLMQKSVSVIIVVFLKESDYRIHFWYMSKDEAMDNMKKTMDHLRYKK